MHLERLAVYHDSGSTSWELEKAWEDMTPEEWGEVHSSNHILLRSVDWVLFADI